MLVGFIVGIDEGIEVGKVEGIKDGKYDGFAVVFVLVDKIGVAELLVAREYNFLILLFP